MGKKKYRETLSRSDIVTEWDEIAKIIGEHEGRPVSRQAVQQSHLTLLKKLRYALGRDPYVKDWLADHGLEVE